ncbi:LLM class flavin-dependent oxidoreductase [Amycolatopsis acidicola]|uniref:LLM class flavin-dependent oxidoreductase n=1 Tax=Amycolatopsis acidicola TaxID=2596893 RepID=A0A5N0UR71_9PSEU|nr:LLM class flavin-dependent oxidoreductase [Amycolatopsis acidicola]KAA9150009.1 LLM class flavin-dependent oxidoreductase [Amycolatopsis acidicola]
MGTTIEDARRALGPVGVALPVSFAATAPIDAQREAVGRLERAGYRAVWTNEVLGKDALVQLSVLLAATERMVFGTCIANVWAREPETANGAAATLAQAYPGRLVLGLGVGYPAQAEATGREFGSPLARMRDYLSRMDSETYPPAPDAAYPRIIAANGPKMLALAGEISDGALPAMYPPEQTAQARQLLGPDKLLVTGLSVGVNPDPTEAKAEARQRVEALLEAPAYRKAMAGLGYSTEADDRLVAAVVPHRGPDSIAAKVHEHLAAGADHVTLLLPIGTEFEAGIAQLENLAPALRF